MIWTDCDREGEHIGQEIVDAAKAGNATIQVKRARFSNVERAYGFVQAPNMLIRHTLTFVSQTRVNGSQTSCRVGREASQCRFSKNRVGYSHWIRLHTFHNEQSQASRRTSGRADPELWYGILLSIRHSSAWDLELKKQHRIMPVSNSRLRGGSVFPRQKLCP